MSFSQKTLIPAIMSISLIFYGCQSTGSNATPVQQLPPTSPQGNVLNAPPSEPSSQSQQNLQSSNISNTSLNESSSQSQENLQSANISTSSNCTFPNNSQTPAVPKSWTAYSDPKYCFSLQYPQNLAFNPEANDASLGGTTDDGLETAEMTIPDSYYGTNTNLAEGYIDITISKDLSLCSVSGSLEDDNGNPIKLQKTLTNNGLAYYEDTWEEGATGSTQGFSGYYVVHNNLCYQFYMNLLWRNHDGYKNSDGSYPPGTPVEFNHTKMEKFFNDIFHTFQIGDISN